MKSLSMFKSKKLGQVSYDGCRFTYHKVGHVKVITCFNGRSAWDIASSLSDTDIDKIWRDIKAQAKATV